MEAKATGGAGGGGGSSDYILIRDEKAQNVPGGTFTAGAWRTRTLNTEVFDTGNDVTLASNQITLLAGTYRVSARAQGHKVDRHQLRLQNITDAVTEVTGRPKFADDVNLVTNDSTLTGKFTIAGTKVLELQHRCELTFASAGFGVAGNFTTEIYAEIEFWKEV